MQALVVRLPNTAVILIDKRRDIHYYGNKDNEEVMTRQLKRGRMVQAATGNVTPSESPAKASAASLAL